jgi:small-conductance mechanosensitive channel
VKKLTFFHTQLLLASNEGVNIPNGSILGGALQNNSDNYDRGDATGLRVVSVGLRVAVSEDLDKVEKALIKAGKTMDTYIKKLNSDETKKDFANGTHSLAEYHKLKYGSALADEQAKSPSGVFVGGQVLGVGSGLDLTLYCYCDNILFNTVKQEAFRVAVKCLKEANISLA